MGQGREERQGAVVSCLLCGQDDSELDAAVYFLVECPFCGRGHMQIENVLFEKRTPRRAELRLVE